MTITITKEAWRQLKIDQATTMWQLTGHTPTREQFELAVGELSEAEWRKVAEEIVQPLEAE